MIGNADIIVPGVITKDRVSQSEDSVLCYCVKYLRHIHGVPIYGDADKQRGNISMNEAAPGDVVLLKYGDISHAALLKEKRVDGLVVQEANFKECQETTRIIPYDDHIKGFQRPLGSFAGK